jgi:N-acetylglucosamine repressor
MDDLPTHDDRRPATVRRTPAFQLSPRSSARQTAPSRARRRVLDILLGETLSRAELARVTRLSKPTISAIVARLIGEGIVQEIGAGASTGGRTPTLLQVRGMSRLVAGVEIDAASCRFLLATLHGEQLVSIERPMASSDAATVVETIAAGIEALVADRDRGLLLGCGVAVPGLVDLAHNMVDCATRLGWKGVPLRALLEGRLGVPVMVTDRGKAAGLGELWHLGKEKPHDVIYLYLGRGVAGAVVLDRELHWGASYAAGEIGHMIVDPDGPPCECGSRGCLEALVSTSAIFGQARTLLAMGRQSTLARDLATAGRADSDGIRAIGAAARRQDPLALEIVGGVARWLGLAIANLVNVLNPAVVVLGGPVAEWGSVLTDAIERALERSALPLHRQAVRVVTGRARETAVPLGAAVLVLQRAGELLTSPEQPAMAPAAAAGA